jgi:hypothetical protein
MWKRNLLFVGLVGGALVALGASLLPPREPKPRTQYNASAYRDPGFLKTVSAVDAAFQQEWQAQKLQPAPQASDLALARRLALGLAGTIPSLEEIRQLEYLPPGERLVWWTDHLLQDSRHHEYFAERLARAYVGTDFGSFFLYRRNRFVVWLTQQMAQNRPYNHLVRDLISTQGIWTNEPAVNFISVTLKEDNGNQPDPVQLAGRTARAFLALRLDCAECHNHPYRPWKQSEFRELTAFYGQTKLGFRGIYDDPKAEYKIDDKRTGENKVIAPAVPFGADWLPQHGSRRERLAAWVTDRRNPFFAKAIVNRVWALMTGRPLVSPVDNLEDEEAHPPALQILAEDFVTHHYDIRRLIHLIASTEVFRRDSAADHELTDAHEEAWAAFPLTRLRPEQVAGGIIQASYVSTVDSQSHFFIRISRFGQLNEFLKRYGDTGEDDFEGRGGTIPQRLLLMNGQLTRERIKEELLSASGRIAAHPLDDAKAVEVAYLTVLTRRPTPEETAHFTGLLAEPGSTRARKIEDLFWSLINSTEFSWNH